MDFDLTADQQMLQRAFTQLADRFRDIRAGEADYLLDAHGLDAALVESGFLDVALEDGCGALEAVLLIEALAGCPRTVEVMASALVAPLALGHALPRPVALARAPLGAPIRFLSQGGGTLVVDDGMAIRTAAMSNIASEAVEAPFNVPLRRVQGFDDVSAAIAPHVDVEEFRRLWRLGAAAEIVGAMRPALELTTEYVKQRHQFGRPIGAFQAIQHRLAECHVTIEGARLLTYDAAISASPAAAALALSYAQEAALRVAYETQQFHGAIGLTLEYPLHYWSYRLRFLAGELGGNTAQALVAAKELWNDEASIPDTFLGRNAAFS